MPTASDMGSMWEGPSITQERLEPFIKTGRYITLFPIVTGARMEGQLDTIDYNRLRYNDEFVTKYWKPEDGEKADIAEHPHPLGAQGRSTLDRCWKSLSTA